MEITRELAYKVLQTVDAGLVSGIGVPEPGRMCVEAAVNYAMGLPHGDNPSCVGSAVRAFKIALNDAPWSSPQARAKGMRKLAIAQLGSGRIDQVDFANRLVQEALRVTVPYAESAAEYAAKCAARCAAKYAAESSDEALVLLAGLALDVLIEMKSPGCQFLFLTDEGLAQTGIGD